MTRHPFSAAALCLLLVGCQDKAEPDAAYSSTEAVVDQGAAEAERSVAIKDPETGAYVPTIPGDPAGTAAPQELEYNDPAGDRPEAGEIADQLASDPDAKLARTLLECNDLPVAERDDCRERVDATHAGAPRDPAPGEGGGTSGE
ncbi:hypothetical protein [Arenimonas sp.]|uniref:hypothetical protein n=1 Tax=Arenimonas sp. TaxID=1872635 RepID=UPI0025C7222E|nr:hypothetical protein [Arenimonas sp.]